MAAITKKVTPFIKQTIPDVLQHLDEGQKQELTQMVTTLKGLASELTETAAGQVDSVKGSKFNHPAIFTPAAGAWVATVGASLKTLEGTCSKSVDETCYFQIGAIGSFVFLTVALLVVIYVRNKRFETTQVRTKNRDLLKAMEGRFHLFKKARSLAEGAIAEDVQNPLELLNRLKPFFVGSKSRSVPSDLASQWGTAIYLANKPEKLRNHINANVLPLIKHYVEDLGPKLQTLQTAMGVAQGVLGQPDVAIELPEEEH
ncbi:MAG: hypothetical protein K2P51_01220 [Rhabdochlamydiaceae bacterium]|nr:hypothetical protein [Rhabdochlamydiaceae bacterium]